MTDATPELTFSEVEQPKEAGRPSGPNPFEGKFPTVEGKALALVLDGDAEANKTTINRITSQARTHADSLEPKLTARVKVTTEGKGKTAKTTLTIWTRDKITRAKGTASEPSTPTEA